MLRAAARWFIVSLAGLLALSAALPASAQDSTATVELRVWQRIQDPLGIYVSARHEAGSWSTLGTIPLPLDQETRSGTFRYGDISLEVPLASGNLTTNVELRVWQRIQDPLGIYVSARHEVGRWNTLGTIPLPLDRETRSGTFRYGDTSLDVPLPPTEEPPPPPIETSRPLADTQNLNWLRHYHADLYRQLTALPWVSDGVTETETAAVDNLLYVGVCDIGNLRSILNLRWVRDDLTSTEASAVEGVYWLSCASAEDAASVIAMPWFRDAVTQTEAEAVRSLAWLSDEDDASGVDLTAAVTAMRWFQDGVNQTERDLLRWLANLDYESEEAAIAVVDMPWFRDDVKEVEVGAIRSLAWLSVSEEGDASGGDTVTSVVALRWFRDGINQTEHDLLLWLTYLDYWSEEAAGAVVDMPFLSSVEFDDVLAVRSLHRLAYSRDGRLHAVLTHPNVRDGITDDETTLVAATGTIRGASEVRRILGRGNARTEVVFEKTRHTPNLKISIIRTGTQPRQSTIDDIKASVEFVERLMNLPLPVSHIIVVVDDYAVTEGYGGTNYGFAFSVLSDDEQHETPFDTFTFRSKIIHETAHFFWRGHASWIDEGMANTFEYLYGVDERVSPGLREQASRDGCEAHDLQMLTEWDATPEQEARYSCSYFLGQSLFQELLEELGRTAFTQGLRELYRLSLDTKDNPEEETPSVAEVREAFADQAAIVEKHWSGALNAPENRAVQEGVPRWSHGLIRWDQFPTFDGVFVTFSGTLLEEAILFNETLAEARSGGYSNFTVASADGYDHVGAILPPLTSGRWTLDDPGDAVATDYRLERGTFTVKFRPPAALGAPSDYVILIWGFQDTAETPLFGGTHDVLGYARIRGE